MTHYIAMALMFDAAIVLFGGLAVVVAVFFKLDDDRWNRIIPALIILFGSSFIAAFIVFVADKIERVM